MEKEIIKKCINCYVDMGLSGAKPNRAGNGFVWEGDKNLGVYEKEFETPLIESTRKEFNQKANRWISELNCPEYNRKVDLAFCHEEQAADYWLQPETKVKIMRRVIDELVTQKAESVVEKDTGCTYMFQNKRLQELTLMYKNFKRDDNTLGLIIQKMNPYIEDCGDKVVKN